MQRILIAATALALLHTAGGAATGERPAAVAGMTALPPVSEKIGAPVDVYYRHLPKSGSSDDPTMQLSFVPRAPGSLRVELLPGRGVRIDKGGEPIALQKTSASAVYNRRLSVQRLGTGPAYLRALVTVDLGDARFFSVFHIPADAAAASQQKSSVPATKQRPVRQL